MIEVIGAENGPPERRVTEERRGKDVMHEVGGIVVTHRDLFEYDAALHIHVVRRHGRVQHDIDDDIDGKRQIPIEHRRVVAGVLLLRECVQLATNVHPLRSQSPERYATSCP